MTKTLSLLRHAKSSWDDPVSRDFDRPLNDRGEQAAKLMGKWLKGSNLHFDHVIASPAVRVIETLDHVAAGYGQKFAPVWERRIYLASSATLMDILREADDTHEHILMAGHNPGMEDMVLDLVPDTSGDALREEVYQKFPTASFAQIKLDIDSWAGLTRGCGSLAEFKRPRDLDPRLGPEDD